MKRKRWQVFSLAAILLLGWPYAVGGAEGKNEPAQISINAEGVVKAVPDVAVLRLTILTEAPKAAQAAGDNARLAETVTTAVKKLLKDKDSLKTLSYQVYPVYSQPEKGKRPQLAGYRARHLFQVRVPDPTRLGEIIEVAIQQGTVEVSGPWWEHSRLEALIQEAAVQALQKARTLANALAHSQQLRVKRLLKVSTSPRPENRPPGQMLHRAAAPSETPPTTIEVGEEEVRAQVEAVFELE